jgi:hypothetical protein
MGGVGGSFLYTDVMTIPPGKIFVATSFQAEFWDIAQGQSHRFWLGKNYDPTIGYPNGAGTDWSQPSTTTQLISAGLVIGSERMGAYQENIPPTPNTGQYAVRNWQKEMQVVYRAGDVLSMIRIGGGLEDNLMINGYWLNTE